MNALPLAGGEGLAQISRKPDIAHKPAQEPTAFASQLQRRDSDEDLPLRQPFSPSQNTQSDDAFLTSAELLSAATRSLSSSLPAEVYAAQAFASGQLSYLERDQSNVILAKTAGNGNKTESAFVSTSADRHDALGVTKTALLGTDMASIFAALLAEISEQSDTDSDAWVKRVSQAITETLEPWLRRRISVNREGESVQILVRDFSASDAELGHIIRTITDYARAKFGNLETTVIVNGNAVSQQASADKESKYAR